jgi:hypothetical protein
LLASSLLGESQPNLEVRAVSPDYEVAAKIAAQAAAAAVAAAAANYRRGAIPELEKAKGKERAPGASADSIRAH